MDTEQLNRAYRLPVEQDPAAHRASALAVRDYIARSTAKYHGRCVRTLYLPKLFTGEDIALFRRTVEVCMGIFRKIVAAYCRDAGFRRLFGFDPRIEALILLPPRYPQLLPQARIDLFYDEASKDFTFCEFNTDGTSAMNEDRELNIALTQTQAYQAFAKTYPLASFELFDSYVDAFLEIYRASPRAAAHPHVVITDFTENATVNEFEIFRQRFAARGISCEICDVRDFRLENGRLLTPSGKPADAIYRRAVTSDLLDHWSQIGPFLEGVRTGAVALLGDFRTQIIHNKQLFRVLHLPEAQALLTPEERAFVQAHVPYTVALEPGAFPYDAVVGEKDGWILKPEDSYGSRGVYAGVEFDDPAEWKETLDRVIGRGYLLQAFCRPYQTPNIDLTAANPDWKPYFNLTGLYAYNGQFAGVYSRVSASEIISTQYSEITLPTRYLKEFEKNTCN